MTESSPQLEVCALICALLQSHVDLRQMPEYLTQQCRHLVWDELQPVSTLTATEGEDLMAATLFSHPAYLEKFECIWSTQIQITSVPSNLKHGSS